MDITGLKEWSSNRIVEQASTGLLLLDYFD